MAFRFQRPDGDGKGFFAAGSAENTAKEALASLNPLVPPLVDPQGMLASEPVLQAPLSRSRLNNSDVKCKDFRTDMIMRMRLGLRQVSRTTRSPFRSAGDLYPPEIVLGEMSAAARTPFTIAHMTLCCQLRSWIFGNVLQGGPHSANAGQTSHRLAPCTNAPTHPCVPF